MRRTALAAAALLGAAACAEKDDLPRAIAGADPDRGREVAERAGCGACHAVPGLHWPKGATGGSLAGFGSAPLIAGQFPNQPRLLVQWLRDAPSMAPDVAMPPSPISEAEARDLAAYLYTLTDG